MSVSHWRELVKQLKLSLMVIIGLHPRNRMSLAIHPCLRLSFLILIRRYRALVGMCTILVLIGQLKRDVMNPSYSCLLHYLLDTISLALTKKMVVAVFFLLFICFTAVGLFRFSEGSFTQQLKTSISFLSP